MIRGQDHRYILRREPARELAAVVKVLDARAQKARRRRVDGPRGRDPAAERYRKGDVYARTGTGAVILKWTGYETLYVRLRSVKL
jgi:hypothetical protein